MEHAKRQLQDTGTCSVANQYGQQTRSGLIDLNSFLSADHPQSSLAAEDAEMFHLRSELACLQKKLGQMHIEYSSEAAVRRQAVNNVHKRGELMKELAVAQESVGKTQEVANAMFQDIMMIENGKLEEIVAKERLWQQRASHESDAFVESQAQSEKISEQIRQCEERASTFLMAQTRNRQRRQARLARSKSVIMLERYLELNIAREMIFVTRGCVLHKVDQKHSAQSERFVVVSDEEMLLKWGRPPGPLSQNCTRLILKDVIRFHYGRASRASILFSGKHPWLCFSLYTTDRSYDFICPDEWTVRCFVLALSRLCRGVVGVICSSKRFLALKGWCKIEDFCAKRKKTVPRMLLEALRDAAPKRKYTKKNPFTFQSDANPFTYYSGQDLCDDDHEDEEGDQQQERGSGHWRFKWRH